MERKQLTKGEVMEKIERERIHQAQARVKELSTGTPDQIMLAVLAQCGCHIALELDRIAIAAETLEDK